MVIIGRRWFDRIPGNTYHSAELLREKEGGGYEQLARVPFAYGNGDQYQQTAFMEAVKLELYKDTPEDWRKFHFSRESGGDGHLFRVSDVGRRKDL